MYRVGVDIGGTFTDLLLVADDGTSFIGKTLTTHGDPSVAVETAMREGLETGIVDRAQQGTVVHGTTLVTNALIERKGAVTALLTTEGFRDALEIGREHRYELYDLDLELPKPLVPRYLRFDVPERVAADGTVLKPLDEAFVRSLVAELRDKGVRAVAVCYLNSFRNAAHERRTRDLIAEVAPEIRVSVSADVVPEIREFQRTSTTVVNVYVQERVAAYLQELQQRLNGLQFTGSFFVMLSSGGIGTPETAARFPVRMLESGPAAGALAAAALGQRSGYPDLLSFDMGGTTAKLCAVENGYPLKAREFEVDRVYRFRKGSGLPIKIPVIDMIEIGAGGGSIARVDALGLLKVGPESAGAEPGPACYGRGGTRPTVTDANLILGYFDPNYFLGGEMKLDVEAARQALAGVAAELGMRVEEVAWGIHQIVNENMANAARAHLGERGKDPRELPMYAFGGAGSGARLQRGGVAAPAHDDLSHGGGRGVDLRPAGGAPGLRLRAQRLQPHGRDGLVLRQRPVRRHVRRGARHPGAVRTGPGRNHLRAHRGHALHRPGPRGVGARPRRVCSAPVISAPSPRPSSAPTSACTAGPYRTWWWKSSTGAWWRGGRSSRSTSRPAAAMRPEPRRKRAPARCSRRPGAISSRPRSTTATP